MTIPPHYIAIPKSGSGPGVLVLHSWWGLNPFFKGLCDRFADNGFVALAPDLYAGKVAATVIFYAARNGDFTQSNSSFLFHFAENDEWVSAASVRKLKKSLEAAGKNASYYDYPATHHWFFESDQPDAFHREAAALAWKRTLVFLKDSGLTHPN